MALRRTPAAFCRPHCIRRTALPAQAAGSRLHQPQYLRGRRANHTHSLATRSLAVEDLDLPFGDAERTRQRLDDRGVRFTIGWCSGDRNLQPIVDDRPDAHLTGAWLHEHLEGHGAVSFGRYKGHPFFAAISPSSRLRLVAASTALMSVVRNPPSSSVCS